MAKKKKEKEEYGLKKDEKKIKSVKDLIVEMKDFAVLAVDLAYCAVLFNSDEIAKEVSNIERTMDGLRFELEKAVLKSATSGVDERELIGILRIGAYSERISDVAEDMATKVLRDQVHEVERIALKEAEEQFFRLKIDSELAERTVSEVGDIKNIWIIAIRRGKKWLHHPIGSTKVKKKDLIFGSRR